MRTITRAALITLTATAIGATSLAPAFAQPFGNGPHGIQRIPGTEARSFRPGPDSLGGMPGGIFGMFFSERGAEAIDVLAVRLTHRLDLTQDQRALLEDLRLAAIDAQEDFAAVREEFASTEDDETAEPDLIARYASMVAVTTARAEALKTVQPAFEAFVSSLDDAQVETLLPRRSDWPRERAAAPGSED